ncbi:hypothetical protein HanIR_Chr06g0272711 [Helianthus annuus]|nr:hypothetical protein HanIR_Chr06g0272711 [Helianthus annuus]
MGIIFTFITLNGCTLQAKKLFYWMDIEGKEVNLVLRVSKMKTSTTMGVLIDTTGQTKGAKRIFVLGPCVAERGIAPFVHIAPCGAAQHRPEGHHTVESSELTKIIMGATLRFFTHIYVCVCVCVCVCI